MRGRTIVILVVIGLVAAMIIGYCTDRDTNEDYYYEVTTPRLDTYTIESANNLTVEWWLVRHGISELEYNISITNDKAELRNLNISFLADNLNFDGRKISNIKLYSLQSQEITEINTECSRYQTKGDDTYCVEWKNVSRFYTVETWVPIVRRPTFLSRDTVRNEFPILPIASKGAKHFKLIFNVPVTLGEGFGNAGRLALDINGREFHPWWDSNWARRKTINITGPSATLYNFTVFLNVSYDTDMQADFDDLRFINDSCDSADQDDELKFEFDKRTNSNAAQVWILLPTFNTGTTHLCMYYDNAGASDASEQEDVWNNDHVLVFHFTDVTEDNFTGSKNVGILNGKFNDTSVSWETGTPMGDGVTIINGSASAGGIDIADNALLDLTDNATYEFWYKALGNTTSPGEATKHSFWSKDTASGAPKLKIDYLPANNITFQWYNTAWRIMTSHDSSNMSDLGWHHYAVTYNKPNISFYMDGQLLNSNTTVDENLPVSATWGKIGVDITDTRYACNGTIDEFRIYNKTQSPAWIARSFQNPNLSQVVYNPEETTGIEIGTPAIVPSLAYYNDSLNCSATYDSDSGNPGTLNFLWFKNDELNVTYDSQATGVVDTETGYATELVTGLMHFDNWTCMVNGTDGTAWSDGYKNSTALIVENLPPTVPTINAPADNASYYSNFNVTLNCTGSTDGEGDTIYYVFFANASYANVTNLDEDSIIGNYSGGNLTWENPAETFYWTCTACDDWNSSDHPDIRKVNKYTFSSCTGADATKDLVLNFTFYNETDDLTKKVSVDFDLSIDGWFENQSNLGTFNLSVDGAEEVGICLAPTNVTAYADATISYVADDTDKRYYYLTNATLTNNTQKIFNYLLDSDLSSGTTLHVEDELDNPLIGYYIYVERFYPGENVYRTVTIGRTDEEGKDYQFLRAYDQLYRFKIYDYITHKLTTVPTKITSADIYFEVTPATEATELEKFDTIDYTIEFDNTTRTFTFDYTQTTGESIDVWMDVRKRSARNDTYYCREFASGASGTLTCTVSSEEGLWIADVYGTISGTKKHIDSVTHEAISKLADIIGKDGAFYTLLIVLALALVGIYKPEIAVGMATLGIVTSALLGIWYFTYASIITLVIFAFVIIFKLKT